MTPFQKEVEEDRQAMLREFGPTTDKDIDIFFITVAAGFILLFLLCSIIGR